MKPFSCRGHIVDIIQQIIFPGEVKVANGKIVSITQLSEIDSDQYILPGFIDAHIHIESSLLVPSEFARLAAVHGTVATVSDPHEIGNVMGIEGVRYMIDNGKKVPFHFYFGAPSCVPATRFETAGATIGPDEIRQLFLEFKLHFLSEVMDYPGVLQNDPLVMKKIEIAKEFNCQIDGHAPGLKGEMVRNYIQAGMTTDHECFTLKEALEKLKYGMKILIREGSAAKNYEALHFLITTHPAHVMFCSDDKHPHELVEGHMNQIVRRSIEKGHELMKVLRCASYNPVQHYGLKVGLLQPGDPADFIVVDNLKNFKVQRTYIKGQLVAQEGKSLIKRVDTPPINRFNCQPKTSGDFKIKAQPGKIQAIKVVNGQLITEKSIFQPKQKNEELVSDPEQDLLKIAVVNRYHNQPVALGFIHQFGLKTGAIASCVAHDSHNIVCVGVSDEDICQAVNAIIKQQGGIAVYDKGETQTLPLTIAGIMSHCDGYQVAEAYSRLDRLSKEMGSLLQAPFMILSFMTLLVIPSLKLSDKGLFDGTVFAFTDLYTKT